MKFFKLTKKIISIICVFMLVCGSLPTAGFAASGDAEKFKALLTEEMLTNEVADSVTKNLDLAPRTRFIMRSKGGGVIGILCKMG